MFSLPRKQPARQWVRRLRVALWIGKCGEHWHAQRPSCGTDEVVLVVVLVFRAGCLGAIDLRFEMLDAGVSNHDSVVDAKRWGWEHCAQPAAARK